VRILRRDQEIHDISSQGMLYLAVVVIVFLVFALGGVRHWFEGASVTPTRASTVDVYRSP
jgi:hypothetical protein